MIELITDSKELLDSDKIRVTFNLEEKPSKNWCNFFENPSGVAVSLRIKNPIAQGDQIIIRIPKVFNKYVEQYIEDSLEDIANRIEGSNVYAGSNYAQSLLKKIQSNKSGLTKQIKEMIDNETDDS